jgi:hypothetical protein
MRGLAIYAANSATASSKGGGLTLLFISLALIAWGAFNVFDPGGFVAKSIASNTGVTPWGRKLSSMGKFPNIYKVNKIIGWVLIIAGVPLMLLSAVSLLV